MPNEHRGSLSFCVVIAVSVFFLSAVSPTGCNSDSPRSQPPRSSAQTGPPIVVLCEDFTERQTYPENNWWNMDISEAPVDPNSTAYINYYGASENLHPDWGNHPYGIPYIGVSGNEPLREMYFKQYPDESDVGASGQPPGYPIPGVVKTDPIFTEGGVDRHCIVVDRDNWFLYETYQMDWSVTNNRWEPSSGAFFDLNVNHLRPEGWTSSDASGLAIFPGLVKYDEVYGADAIDHAFRCTVSSSDGHVWPARHTAGGADGALPMGARFRLKASFDISGFSAPMQKILQAMKTYGLILTDNGSDVYVTGTKDSRWNMDNFVPQFHSITIDNFEIIQLGWGKPTGIPKGN